MPPQTRSRAKTKTATKDTSTTTANKSSNPSASENDSLSSTGQPKSKRRKLDREGPDHLTLSVTPSSGRHDAKQVRGGKRLPSPPFSSSTEFLTSSLLSPPSSTLLPSRPLSSAVAGTHAASHSSLTTPRAAPCASASALRPRRSSAASGRQPAPPTTSASGRRAAAAAAARQPPQGPPGTGTSNHHRQPLSTTGGQPPLGSKNNRKQTSHHSSSRQSSRQQQPCPQHVVESPNNANHVGPGAGASLSCDSPHQRNRISRPSIDPRRPHHRPRLAAYARSDIPLRPRDTSSLSSCLSPTPWPFNQSRSSNSALKPLMASSSAASGAVATQLPQPPHHHHHHSHHQNSLAESSSSSSSASIGHTNGHHKPQMMGSTSTSSGLRRSARNLRSVNEVIGGKVQEIFVLDDDDEDTHDDEAPPNRPLAADLSNESVPESNGKAKVNGSAHRPTGSLVAKGKRKAQGSPAPPPHPLYEEASSTAAAAAAAAQAAKKRRREAPPSDMYPQPPPPMANHTNHVNTTIDHRAGQTPNQAQPASTYGYYSYPANYSTTAAGAPRPPPPAALPASYRGGYAAGTGSVSNGAHPTNPSRQQILDSADAAQRKLIHDRQIQQSFMPGPPAAPSLPIDDKDGHYIVREGEWISDPRSGDNRYKILSQLGQGTFGKVVECYDRRDRNYVAIKVIRAVQKYRDASQIEIRVLQTLKKNDVHNDNKCIHMLDTFSYRNHVCIVTELLGKSVFDFLKDNSFQPFPPSHIWSFARQLLTSVAFIHRLELIHTDLKPENILLVNGDYDWNPISKRSNARKKKVLKDTDVRLIDFGSATFQQEYHSQVVSTRHYRAPEIILNMGWSFPCDAWSIGCILIEFYTGDALFQTHDNLEHLAMMEQVLGPMPEDFRRKAETFKAEYFRHGRLDFPNPDTPKNSKRYVAGMRKMSEIISKASTWKKHNERFLSLLKRLLDFDPQKRIKVADALDHPYFDLLPSEIPP